MSLTVNWNIATNKKDFNRMSASVWIRCLQLIPYLEERGVRCRVNEPDSRADVSVFVRWQDNDALGLAKRLRGRGEKVVFDLCVNYFDETGYFDGGYGTTQREVKECARMVAVADAVTCSSAFIAERAAEHHPWAMYLPDSVDARHFRYQKDLQDFQRPQLRAIFSGTASKANELEPILPLLRERDIPLTVISNREPELTTPSRFVTWSYESFPKRILEGEICVAFRPVDNRYNQGHSLFKVGVFMAQGVPAVASPVPSYEEVVLNGTGGALCRSLTEWEESLDLVMQDRQQLVEWSEQARSNLREYHTERVVGQYVDLFRTLSQREPEANANERARDGYPGSLLGRLRRLWRAGSSARPGK